MHLIFKQYAQPNRKRANVNSASWMLSKKVKCKTNNIFCFLLWIQVFCKKHVLHTQEWLPSWTMKRKTESSLYSETLTPLWVGVWMVNNPQRSWILLSTSINSHCMDIIIAHHPKWWINGSAAMQGTPCPLSKSTQSAHELLFTPHRLLFIVIYQ